MFKTILTTAISVLFASHLSIANATPESDEQVWVEVARLTSDTPDRAFATLEIQSPWETDGSKAKVIYKIERHYRSPKPNYIGTVIIDCKKFAVETLGSVRILSNR